MTASPTMLLDLTARDLMTVNPVVLPERLPLREAARLLWKHHVSGAPVVDADGRCVGVLSAVDFLPWAEQEGPGEKPPGPLLCAVVQRRRPRKPASYFLGTNSIAWERLRGYLREVCTYEHKACISLTQVNRSQAFRLVEKVRMGELQCRAPPSY